MLPMSMKVKIKQSTTPEQNFLTESSIQQISEILFDADSGLNLNYGFRSVRTNSDRPRTCSRDKMSDSSYEN